MKSTKIEWTDATVNFWWGCTKVSKACQFCYAETIAQRLGKKLVGHPVKWGDGNARGHRLGEARAAALQLNAQALRQGKRLKVFVNSMSDWLDDQVWPDWLQTLLSVVAECRHLDFQLLTKRPQNWRPRMEMVSRSSIPGPGRELARRWLQGSPPPNVWIGVTAEDQASLDTRMPHLVNIPAHVRFLSCEPLLGPLDFAKGVSQYFPPQRPEEKWDPAVVKPYLKFIHWVIAGGESGQHARPALTSWFISIRNQCKNAGVPFFFKQYGEWRELPLNSDLVTHVVRFNAVGNPDISKLKHPSSTPERLIEIQTLPAGYWRGFHRPGKKSAGHELQGTVYQEFPVV